MKQYALAYVVVFFVTLAIDAIWLSLAYGRLYKPHLGHLLAENLSFAPAGVFYLIYAGGVVFFAVSPALSGGNWLTAAFYGAAFGFCAYATYDLTNQATLRDWPVLITVVDMGWGALLTAVAATIGHLVASRV